MMILVYSIHNQDVLSYELTYPFLIHDLYFCLKRFTGQHDDLQTHVILERSGADFIIASRIMCGADVTTAMTAQFTTN
jgi:hypothetical protein